MGFKWFVDGLRDGSLGFGGEESAGASFLRRDGATWTTDKDGLIFGLLAAEITARIGHDPGEAYGRITQELGVRSTPGSMRRRLRTSGGCWRRWRPIRLGITTLADEQVARHDDRRTGNNAPIGGIKVVAESGWFALRPSGHRGRLQDLCREFSQRRPPAADPATGDGRGRAGVCDATLAVRRDWSDPIKAAASRTSAAHSR